jgi:hypothetical protein
MTQRTIDAIIVVVVLILGALVVALGCPGVV